MAKPRRRTGEEQAIFGAHGNPIAPAKIWEGFDISVHADVEKMPIPSQIAEHPRKMALWNFICSDMANRGILTPTYVLVVKELVETVVMLDEYRYQLDNEGPITEMHGSNGTTSTKMNPLFSAVSKLQATLLSLLSKVGMSPRDIHYLSNPDATAIEPIQVQVTGKDSITYFRK